MSSQKYVTTVSGKKLLIEKTKKFNKSYYEIGDPFIENSGDCYLMDDKKYYRIETNLLVFDNAVKKYIVKNNNKLILFGIINDKCETNVKGLYACGEVAGGTHGANRLAGNALAETVVFGEIAGKNAAEFASSNDFDYVDTKGFFESLPKITDDSSEKELIKEIKEILWIYLGIIRDEKGIKTAIKEISKIKNKFENIRSTKDLLEYFKLRNIIFVAEAISIAALERKESRGAHYRSDYPKEDINWKKAIIIKKEFKIENEAR